MGMSGKRAGGATIGGRCRAKKPKVDASGLNIRRTMRGEVVFVPAPPGSDLAWTLKFLPRPRGLFAAKED